MPIEFLVTSLVIIATPGTGSLYTVVMGLTQGRRSSLYAALGCTLGLLVHIVIAISGAATIFHSSPRAFSMLSLAGAAYMLYMAASMLRNESPLALNHEESERKALQIIRHAIVINLLNPKLPLFFLAFLPAFVSASESQVVVEMTILSLWFMLLTLIIFALYGWFAALFRSILLSNPRVLTMMQRGFAGAFVLIAIQLAVSAFA